ncbi:hypothetical protein DAETH_48230 (plasmid) [Deinococcus aetherius]|uniref:Phage capsid-like C-terminal domain-containing protein n=1 Tax=Deinococcus aetherius TaxID=200252 RepID=A0ABM8ALX8_9DEIO|nr:phage major capsid protein [Deinococcus aetherius]BDP44854.1 hypothetical protein DAETH_48230 [Deinococcus aetherius]
MPVTRKKDIIIPELLEDAIKGEFAGINALWGSKAVKVNGSLGSTKKGEVVQVPYFGNLGELEDLADDEGGDGALPALTPAKLTMTSEEARVHHSGKAFEVTEWAEMSISYADPYAEAARQLREAVFRRADKALIDVARTTDLVLDLVTNPIDGKSTLGYDGVVKAKYLWGDEGQSVSSMTMHSKVGADVELLKDGDGKPLVSDAIQGQGARRFVGVPYTLSDKLTIAGATEADRKYETLLARDNSMLFWYNGDFQVQTDKDILTDSRVAAVHIYWLAHRYKRMPGSTRTGVAKIVSK